MNQKLECRKTYYESGNVETEYYILNDQIHNENGPAYIWYYENGDIKEKEYYLNNQLHNENGPALVYYDENGKVMIEYYYLNGKQITKEEFERHKLIKDLAGVK